MTTTINHETRQSLGLTLVEYAILDFCAQRERLLLGTGINIVSETLGIPKALVTELMKSLATTVPSLLVKRENGYYYPSDRWYMAHWERVEAPTTQAKQTASDVIAEFNKINGTRYATHTYEQAVVGILKANPTLTLEHFKSIFLHKKLTWGADEKMAMYNRPATIFSKKFMVYLDEANLYWINKANHDQASL